VARVVDGDTLLLASGARVRMLGIDAPESVRPNHPVEPWGREASAFTKQAISAHSSQVRLTFDRERQDRYQRFLAYVWIEERLLNEELVRRGLATAELQYNYSPAIKRRLKRAEDAARTDRVGIWLE
jgi:micrococcal nuclease